MSCAEVDAALYGYVSCSLPLPMVEAFYRHLAQCEDCRIHVTCYRTVVVVLQKEGRTLAWRE